MASGGPLKLSNGSSHIPNGKPSRKPLGKAHARQRKGIFAWTLSLVARLTIWSAILTVIFRCPSSLDACDERSPLICEHYFRAREALSPHLQPYYEQYAASYVNAARPYYDAIDSRVLVPTRVYAVRYAAPLVRWGQDYASSQWQLNGQPRLARVQASAITKYNRSVAPHIAKAGEIFEPYYQIARTNSLQFVYGYLVPSYEFVRPHAARGFGVASTFAVHTALPATNWAWNRSNSFLEAKVWPQLRLVYVENVEPQLVRIGERLGRYKNKAKSKVLPAQPHKAVTSTGSAHSSFSKPTPQSSTQSDLRGKNEVVTNANYQQGRPGSDDKPQYPVGVPPLRENEMKEDRTVREMVAHDLQSWQAKIASQAKEGATENKERTDTIARRFIDERVKVTGIQLVSQLNATVQSQLADVKRQVASIAKDPSKDAEEKATGAIRTAGLAIKSSAQAIREWREKFLADLQKAVLDAADEFFVILAETQNLALQKIGMKWAWIDGITYRDWAKYHELRTTLSQWTDELKEQIAAHPKLVEAQDASAEVEHQAMDMASDAAKELSRLKEVATWKILAGDSTDNFDSDAMRMAAEAAQEARREDLAGDKASKEASRATEGAADEITSVDEVFSNDLKAASSSSNLAVGPIGKAGQESPQSAKGSGNANTGTLGSVESAKTIVPEAPADVISPETKNSATLDDAEALEASGEDPQDAIADDSVGIKKCHERGKTPVRAAMFGAAAQAVSDRGPILDEIPDPDRYGSATAAAQAAYTGALAAASAQYSSALSVVSAQVYGTPKPVHEQLFSSVSSAYDNAVGAASQRFSNVVSEASRGIYGEPTPTSNSAKPGWDKVESMAAQRLSEGRLWAQVQYQSALLALGMATSTPAPSNAAEKVLEQAKFNYYAGLGMAEDRYTSFLSAASSAWSSMTATPTPTATDLAGSASSVASVAAGTITSAAHAAGSAVQSVYSAAGESASSAVQAANSAAQSAYSAATTSVASVANAVEDSLSAVADAAGEQMYVAGSALAGTWDKIVSELSAQMYAEPSAIGWYDELVGNVESYASAATKTAVDGALSATGAAAAAAGAASAKAARQYEAMSEMVSELVHGREPAFSESVLSRFSGIYATASASMGSMAGEASAAASLLGDKVGSAASQATADALKSGVGQARDEL